MKKLLLTLCLAPVAAWAQNPGAKPLVKAPEVMVTINPAKKNDVVRPSTAPQSAGKSGQRSSRRHIPNTRVLGMTTYDLQSNNAIARRVLTYPGGKISVVWTNSATEDNTFLDRGTAYVHFDGTSWSAPNTQRFESERSGWPNLGFVNAGATQQEYIVSHYASGSDNRSGGQYWLRNSQLGGSFTQLFEKDKPNGPLWPRIAVTGKYIHMVAVYNSSNFINGVKNPIVYSRFNTETQQFEVSNQTLPGYDSNRYGQGSADEYAIDSRGAHVAILIGGPVNDVALWKSNDSGKTFTKTIVDSFAHAPVNLTVDTPFDTANSNDGTGTVIIDNNNVAHVFYPRNRVINTTEGDSSYSFFAGNMGLVYWNDQTQQLVEGITGVVDYNNDQALDIKSGTIQSNDAGYGGNNWVSFPHAAVDADNNLYVIYSAPNEEDVYVTGTSNFRHVYVIYSKDGGQNWSDPQDITPTYQLESVFATVAREVDDNLHFVFMRDEEPGISLVNTALPIHPNEIVYSAIPKAAILGDSLGLPHVSINEPKVNNLFSISSIYPNPANDAFNLTLHMARPAQANVMITDVVGKSVANHNGGLVAQGANNIRIDVSTLPAGVYFCTVTAGGFSSTHKLVVEK